MISKGKEKQILKSLKECRGMGIYHVVSSSGAMSIKGCLSNHPKIVAARQRNNG